MTNSKEALFNSYNQGFRYFEVDIQKTSDNRFVAYHLWTENDACRLQIPFDKNNPIPDYKTFLNYRYLKTKFKNGLTPLSLDDIFQFMKTHTDTVFMFDFKCEYDGNILNLIKNFAYQFTDFDIKNRSIIEVYSKNAALALIEVGFKNAQLWIDIEENQENEFKTINEISEFILQNDIKYVSIGVLRVLQNPHDTAVLKSLGVEIYSPCWRSYKKAQKNGIDIVTTDYPMNGFKSYFKKLWYDCHGNY